MNNPVCVAMKGREIRTTQGLKAEILKH